MIDDSWQEFAAWLKDDDPRWPRAFLKYYGPLLRGFLFNNAKRYVVDDLFQNTCANIFFAVRHGNIKIGTEAEFKAYVMSTCRNVIIDCYRRRYKREAGLDAFAAEVGADEGGRDGLLGDGFMVEQLRVNEEKLMINKVMKGRVPADRLILKHYANGHTSQATADDLNGRKITTTAKKLPWTADNVRQRRRTLIKQLTHAITDPGRGR